MVKKFCFHGQCVILRYNSLFIINIILIVVVVTLIVAVVIIIIITIIITEFSEEALDGSREIRREKRIGFQSRSGMRSYFAEHGPINLVFSMGAHHLNPCAHSFTTLALFQSHYQIISEAMTRPQNSRGASTTLYQRYVIFQLLTEVIEVRIFTEYKSTTLSAGQN